MLIADASRKGMMVSCGVPTGSGPATPARVAAAARIALARGWRPGEGSGEMHMHLPEAPAGSTGATGTTTGGTGTTETTGATDTSGQPDNGRTTGEPVGSSCEQDSD